MTAGGGKMGSSSTGVRVGLGVSRPEPESLSSALGGLGVWRDGREGELFGDSEGTGRPMRE